MRAGIPLLDLLGFLNAHSSVRYPRTRRRIAGTQYSIRPNKVSSNVEDEAFLSTTSISQCHAAAFSLVMALTSEWKWSEIRGVLDPHLNVLSLLLGLFGLYILYLIIYGFFLCPTRHIPGPFLTRFASKYVDALIMGGTLSMTIHELHKKHGMSLFTP